jgi:HEAT repeat protein
MAIEALGHVGGDAGKKAIRDYLQKNPNGELRILMAAIRSLGYLQDREAIPALVAIMNAQLNKAGKGGWGEGGFRQKPTYLSATAAEALGRIGGADVEKEILASLGKLGNYESHVMFTGEHGWLRSAQASPVYFRMLEALDRAESKGAGPHAAKLVMSLQSDKDRGLLYELDTYEKLVGRVIERSGKMDDVVEACFAVLGEPSPPATGAVNVDPALKAAVSKAPHNEKHIRRHTAQSRAAQVMSIVCNDAKYADRIRAVLLNYRAQKPSETRSWTCFMLTRTLGRLGDAGSMDLFIEMLEKDPTEASLGLNPPPAHIIYKAWRPFYRPAAAWSLGQMKAKKAVPALLAAVQNLDNASSTREQAAIALGLIGDKSVLSKMKEIGEDYPEITTRRALLEAVIKMSE